MSQYKPYPAYKDSGVEWLGRVPEHWHVARMRYVATLNPPVRRDLLDDPEQEVSFLPMEAIGEDGSLNLEQNRPVADVRSGYSYFENGDVAFAKVTPCFENGKGALMLGLQYAVGFGTTELTVLRPNPAVADACYINYIVQASSFRAFGAGAMTGAGGLKRVPDEFTRNFPVSLPDLNEQRLIASKLDRETARIDALVEKKTRFIELLREKRQALITHAVTKGLDPNVKMKDSGVEWLGDVPEGWEVRSVSSISTKITNGYVGPTRDILVEDGVRYLQSLHIKDNQIKFDVPYFVSEEWSNKHRKSILEAGDVLIVQTGDIGQVTVVTDEFVGCNCHALIIVSPERGIISGKWISWVFNSGYGYHVLLSIQTGAMHPHLNCGKVKDVLLPVPPLSEQHSIIRRIEHEELRVNALVSKTEHSITLLKERRSALITAAVTGQIDLREAV